MVKAVEFYKKILKIRSEFEKVDQSTLDFLVQHALTGLNIYPKNSVQEHFSENEIENLIHNYNLPGIGSLLKDITIYETIAETDNALYIFGSIDGYLCFNNDLVVTWNDESDFRLYSLVAIDPESFLDVVYALAYNNLYRELSRQEICKKLIYLSGSSETKLFYEYLLGLIE